MTGTVWNPPRLTYGRPVAAVITPRQADVLAGIAHGHGNRLGIHEDTVKTHCKHLLRALGARNRAHAAALACSGQLTIVVRGEP